MSPSYSDGSPAPDEPYGDFMPYDADCPRVKELLAYRGKLTDEEAMKHRAICERCMTFAVMTSEFIV